MPQQEEQCSLTPVVRLIIELTWSDESTGVVVVPRSLYVLLVVVLAACASKNQEVAQPDGVVLKPSEEPPRASNRPALGQSRPDPSPTVHKVAVPAATVRGAASTVPVQPQLTGTRVGKLLDMEDLRRAHAAERSALSSNGSIDWTNPDTGHRGKVVLHQPYQEHNSTCRRYVHELRAGGASEVIPRAACLVRGSWRVSGSEI